MLVCAINNLVRLRTEHYFCASKDDRTRASIRTKTKKNSIDSVGSKHQSIQTGRPIFEFRHSNWLGLIHIVNQI